MAEALEYVHEQKYIHRDVCPRNYIYETDTGNIKLIDFGLSLPAKPEFMQPGNRTGTPLYMAPEVVRRRTTDIRLDIFALGVSAYQICTYELPWPVLETTGQAALAHDTQPPRDLLGLPPLVQSSGGQGHHAVHSPQPQRPPPTATDFLRAIRGIHQDDE